MSVSNLRRHLRRPFIQGRVQLGDCSPVNTRHYARNSYAGDDPSSKIEACVSSGQTWLEKLARAGTDYK